MRATFFGLLALAGAAFAQENPFNIPDGGYSNVQAGQPLQLSWKPTTDGPVTLVLRSGDASNLQEGTEITSNAPNNGMYTWSVPADITKGFTYTIQIISQEGDINYTPYFAIDSTNTQPSSTSVVATGAPTGDAALPPVPQTLAAQQSSATSAASTAAVSTDARSSMMSSATSMASSMATSMSSATDAAGSSMMSATAASTSATSAPNAAGALVVPGGLMAGVAAIFAVAL